MNLYKEIYEILKGKSVLLYGNPRVGKSLFISRMAGTVSEVISDKKPILVWVDCNLINTDWGMKLREIAKKSEIIEMRNVSTKRFNSVFYKVRQYGSMLVLDSVSGFEECFYDPDKITSPRVILAMSRLSRWLSREFSILAHDLKIPTILIAHKGIDFNTREEYPRFTRLALKNIDMIMKMEREPDNTVKIEIEFDREAKSQGLSWKFPLILPKEGQK